MRLQRCLRHRNLFDSLLDLVGEGAQTGPAQFQRGGIVEVFVGQSHAGKDGMAFGQGEKI